MGTFRHKDISAPLRFWHVDVMTGTFWHKDTLARDIMARTFDHWDFFCTRTFRHHGRYGTGTFWHKDILALEYFGIRIFWPMDVLVDVHFGTLQSTFMCQNILGLKCSNTVTSPCRSIQSAKNLPMPKSSWTENILVSENSPLWNVRAEMSPAKMSAAKISPSLSHY